MLDENKPIVRRLKSGGSSWEMSATAVPAVVESVSCTNSSVPALGRTPLMIGAGLSAEIVMIITAPVW